MVVGAKSLHDLLCLEKRGVECQVRNGPTTKNLAQENETLENEPKPDDFVGTKLRQNDFWPE